MTYAAVQHKVRDYKSWKEVFDKFADTRRSGGEKTYHVLRTEEDPNNIYMIFQWDNIDHARKFFDSPELKDAMKKAGVVDTPTISFLEHLDEGKL